MVPNERLELSQFIGLRALSAVFKGGVVVAQRVGDRSVDENHVGMQPGFNFVADAPGDDPQRGGPGVVEQDRYTHLLGLFAEVCDGRDLDVSQAKFVRKAGQERALARRVGTRDTDCDWSVHHVHRKISRRNHHKPPSGSVGAADAGRVATLITPAQSRSPPSTSARSSCQAHHVS